MPEENNNQSESQGHPAWQEILSVLPEEFHPLITPKLQEWDEKVQGKLQDQSAFEPYKPLIENKIPMEYIEQAVWLAKTFEENPEDVVAKAIESFNLEKFKPQEQAPATSSTPNPEEELDLTDLEGLENHPAFKQLQEQAEELKRWKQEQESSKEEANASEILEQYLKELHEEKGEFNDFFVTALMANGIDAEEAIETYQTTVKSEAEKLAEALNTETQQSNPPVVMGNSGTAGSGIPEEPVSLGKMGKGEVSDLAAKFIEEANKQG